MYLVEIDTSNLPVLINYFMIKKTTKNRSEEDSDEHRSIDASQHGDVLSSQSRRMNQSKDPKKKEGERRFDQSNPKTNQSQKRKVEERKIEQSTEKD